MRKLQVLPKVVWCLLFAALGCSRGALQSSEGCRPGATECVSDHLLRVCPEDGAGYLAYPCAAEETCQAGACVGPCETGASSCISKEVLRVCAADGKASSAVACPLGSECQNGRCSASRPTPLCEPGEWACATETVGKECDRDGAGWVMTACALGARCSTQPGSQRCVPDPTAASCEPGSHVCLDASTALHCGPDGAGYAVQACPATAPCTNGLCRGERCTLGEARCEFLFNSELYRSALVTCVDGTNWEIDDCSPGEECTFAGVARTDAPLLAAWWNGGRVGRPPVPLPEPLTATCAPYGCDPLSPGNVPVCGSPMDPTLSSTENFSLCEGHPPFSSYEWTSYRCPAPSECDPNLARTTGELCSTECFPGDVRCSPDHLGLQTCNEAGTWNVAGPCDKGQLCANGGQFRPACADAECAFYLNRAQRSGGRCESDTRYRPCGPDGLLAAVDPTCTRCKLEPEAVSTPATPAPYAPGSCVDPLATSPCDLGMRYCASADQYWQCVDSSWSSAEIQRCPVGTHCFPSLDPVTGAATAQCGDCEPGDARCTDDATLQVCDAQGHWQAPVQCAVGFCQWGTRADGTAGHGCRTECLPGSVNCLSATQYQKCGADGRFGATVLTCVTGTTCRVGLQPPHFGCVACVGPNHARGGAMFGLPGSFGLPDSRCEGNALSECQADDTWGRPRECGPNAVCQQTVSQFDASVRATCVLGEGP